MDNARPPPSSGGQRDGSQQRSVLSNHRLQLSTIELASNSHPVGPASSNSLNGSYNNNNLLVAHTPEANSSGGGRSETPRRLVRSQRGFAVQNQNPNSHSTGSGGGNILQVQPSLNALKSPSSSMAANSHGGIHSGGLITLDDDFTLDNNNNNNNNDGGGGGGTHTNGHYGQGSESATPKCNTSITNRHGFGSHMEVLDGGALGVNSPSSSGLKHRGLQSNSFRLASSSMGGGGRKHWDDRLGNVGPVNSLSVLAEGTRGDDAHSQPSPLSAELKGGRRMGGSPATPQQQARRDIASASRRNNPNNNSNQMAYLTTSGSRKAFVSPVKSVERRMNPLNSVQRSAFDRDRRKMELDGALDDSGIMEDSFRGGGVQSSVYDDDVDDLEDDEVELLHRRQRMDSMVSSILGDESMGSIFSELSEWDEEEEYRNSRNQHNRSRTSDHHQQQHHHHHHRVAEKKSSSRHSGEESDGEYGRRYSLLSASGLDDESVPYMDESSHARSLPQGRRPVAQDPPRPPRRDKPLPLEGNCLNNPRRNKPQHSGNTHVREPSTAGEGYHNRGGDSNGGGGGAQHNSVTKNPRGGSFRGRPPPPQRDVESNGGGGVGNSSSSSGSPFSDEQVTQLPSTTTAGQQSSGMPHPPHQQSASKRSGKGSNGTGSPANGGGAINSHPAMNSSLSTANRSGNGGSNTNNSSRRIPPPSASRERRVSNNSERHGSVDGGGGGGGSSLLPPLTKSPSKVQQQQVPAGPQGRNFSANANRSRSRRSFEDGTSTGSLSTSQQGKQQTNNTGSGGGGGGGPLPPHSSHTSTSSTGTVNAGGNSPSGATSTSVWRVQMAEKDDRVGRGSFGEVYRGRDLATGKTIAIKEITLVKDFTKDYERLLTNLEREVRVMRKLHHPNMIQYLGVHRADNALQIYMEFLTGGTIRDRLRCKGHFSDALTRYYTIQLLSGLDYLHRRNIMHRDLKGDNLFLTGELPSSSVLYPVYQKLLEEDPGLGPYSVLKVGDFGTSKELTTTLTTDTVAGTPNFMAPEVVQGAGHSFQADVWSVGCCVLEMLTGHPPFHKKDNQMAILFAVMKNQFMDQVPQPGIWGDGTTTGPDPAAVAASKKEREEKRKTKKPKKKLGEGDDDEDDEDLNERSTSSPALPPHEPITDEARDFISKCTVMERDVRWTVQQLMEHPWILAGGPSPFVQLTPEQLQEQGSGGDGPAVPPPASPPGGGSSGAGEPKTGGGSGGRRRSGNSRHNSEANASSTGMGGGEAGGAGRNHRATTAAAASLIAPAALPDTTTTTTTTTTWTSASEVVRGKGGSVLVSVGASAGHDGTQYKRSAEEGGEEGGTTPPAPFQSDDDDGNRELHPCRSSTLTPEETMTEGHRQQGLPTKGGDHGDGCRLRTSCPVPPAPHSAQEMNISTEEEKKKKKKKEEGEEGLQPASIKPNGRMPTVEQGSSVDSPSSVPGSVAPTRAPYSSSATTPGEHVQSGEEDDANEERSEQPSPQPQGRRNSTKRSGAPGTQTRRSRPQVGGPQEEGSLSAEQGAQHGGEEERQDVARTLGVRTPATPHGLTARQLPSSSPPRGDAGDDAACDRRHRHPSCRLLLDEGEEEEGSGRQLLLGGVDDDSTSPARAAADDTLEHRSTILLLSGSRRDHHNRWLAEDGHPQLQLPLASHALAMPLSSNRHPRPPTITPSTPLSNESSMRVPSSRSGSPPPITAPSPILAQNPLGLSEEPAGRRIELVEASSLLDSAEAPPQQEEAGAPPPPPPPAEQRKLSSSWCRQRRAEGEGEGEVTASSLPCSRSLEQSTSDDGRGRGGRLAAPAPPPAAQGGPPSLASDSQLQSKGEGPRHSILSVSFLSGEANRQRSGGGSTHHHTSTALLRASILNNSAPVPSTVQQQQGTQPPHLLNAPAGAGAAAMMPVNTSSMLGESSGCLLPSTPSNIHSSPNTTTPLPLNYSHGSHHVGQTPVAQLGGALPGATSFSGLFSQDLQPSSTSQQPQQHHGPGGDLQPLSHSNPNSNRSPNSSARSRSRSPSSSSIGLAAYSPMTMTSSITHSNGSRAGRMSSGALPPSPSSVVVKSTSSAAPRSTTQPHPAGQQRQGRRRPPRQQERATGGRSSSRASSSSSSSSSTVQHSRLQQPTSHLLLDPLTPTKMASLASPCSSSHANQKARQHLTPLDPLPLSPSLGGPLLPQQSSLMSALTPLQACLPPSPSPPHPMPDVLDPTSTGVPPKHVAGPAHPHSGRNSSVTFTPRTTANTTTEAGLVSSFTRRRVKLGKETAVPLNASYLRDAPVSPMQSQQPHPLSASSILLECATSSSHLISQSAQLLPSSSPNDGTTATSSWSAMARAASTRHPSSQQQTGIRVAHHSSQQRQDGADRSTPVQRLPSATPQSCSAALQRSHVPGMEPVPHHPMPRTAGAEEAGHRDVGAREAHRPAPRRGKAHSHHPTSTGAGGHGSPTLPQSRTEVLVGQQPPLPHSREQPQPQPQRRRRESELLFAPARPQLLQRRSAGPDHPEQNQEPREEVEDEEGWATLRFDSSTALGSTLRSQEAGGEEMEMESEEERAGGKDVLRSPPPLQLQQGVHHPLLQEGSSGRSGVDSHYSYAHPVKTYSCNESYADNNSSSLPQSRQLQKQFQGVLNVAGTSQQKSTASSSMSRAGAPSQGSATDPRGPESGASSTGAAATGAQPPLSPTLSFSSSFSVVQKQTQNASSHINHRLPSPHASQQQQNVIVDPPPSPSPSLGGTLESVTSIVISTKKNRQASSQAAHSRSSPQPPLSPNGFNNTLNSTTGGSVVRKVKAPTPPGDDEEKGPGARIPLDSAVGSSSSAALAGDAVAETVAGGGAGEDADLRLLSGSYRKLLAEQRRHRPVAVAPPGTRICTPTRTPVASPNTFPTPPTSSAAATGAAVVLVGGPAPPPNLNPSLMRPSPVSTPSGAAVATEMTKLSTGEATALLHSHLQPRLGLGVIDSTPPQLLLRSAAAGTPHSHGTVIDTSSTSNGCTTTNNSATTSLDSSIRATSPGATLQSAHRQHTHGKMNAINPTAPPEEEPPLAGTGDVATTTSGSNAGAPPPTVSISTTRMPLRTTSVVRSGKARSGVGSRAIGMDYRSAGNDATATMSTTVPSIA